MNTAGATAIIPVLPTSAMAAPVAKAPAHAAKIGWAALYARAHAKASPALIQKWLSVGSEQANALMAELVRTKVLNAPVGGIATVTKPMFGPNTVPGAKTVTKNIARRTQQIIFDAFQDEPDLSEHNAIEEEIHHETS